MPLLRRLESSTLYRGGYVSVGNFDGVHTGHRQIARRLTERARQAAVPSVVLTFDPHPLKLLRPAQAPPNLTTLEQKGELLEAAGVDCVIACPTDRALLERTPQQFFNTIIVNELRAKGLIEGPNFCFGKDRQGDIGTLQQLCQRSGVELEIVEPVGGEAGIVSSSTIRALIAAGQMAEAVALLGHPYRIQGDVVMGAQRGRTIGFPTANLANIETLLPADGVYAGETLLDGRRYAAAINIGPNPTFEEGARKVEAHLLDFSGDLYGRRLDVDLGHRIRDVRRFESREDLVRQITQDVEAAGVAFNKRPPLGERRESGERPA